MWNADLNHAGWVLVNLLRWSKEYRGKYFEGRENFPTLEREIMGVKYSSKEQKLERALSILNEDKFENNVDSSDDPSLLCVKKLEVLKKIAKRLLTSQPETIQWWIDLPDTSTDEWCRELFEL